VGQRCPSPKLQSVLFSESRGSVRTHGCHVACRKPNKKEWRRLLETKSLRGLTSCPMHLFQSASCMTSQHFAQVCAGVPSPLYKGCEAFAFRAPRPRRLQLSNRPVAGVVQTTHLLACSQHQATLLLFGTHRIVKRRRLTQATTIWKGPRI
jgi:hypothetical protein